jgi:hypothetical protein
VPDNVKLIVLVKRGPVNFLLWLVLPFWVWSPDTPSCKLRHVWRMRKRASANLSDTEGNNNACDKVEATT